MAPRRHANRIGSSSNSIVNGVDPNEILGVLIGIIETQLQQIEALRARVMATLDCTESAIVIVKKRGNIFIESTL